PSPAPVGEIGEDRTEDDRAETERREHEPDLGGRPAEPLLGEDGVGGDERPERRLERGLDQEEEDEDLRRGRRLRPGYLRRRRVGLPRGTLHDGLRQEQRRDRRGRTRPGHDEERTSGLGPRDDAD